MIFTEELLDAQKNSTKSLQAYSSSFTKLAEAKEKAKQKALADIEVLRLLIDKIGDEE